MEGEEEEEKEEEDEEGVGDVHDDRGGALILCWKPGNGGGGAVASKQGEKELRVRVKRMEVFSISTIQARRG